MAASIYFSTGRENKVYVGSSFDGAARRRTHFLELRRGIHVNKPMQEDYNTDGPDSFAWLAMGAVSARHQVRGLEYKVMRHLESKHELYNRVVARHGELIDHWDYVDFAGMLYLIQQGHFEPAFPAVKKRHGE